MRDLGREGDADGVVGKRASTSLETRGSEHNFALFGLLSRMRLPCVVLTSDLDFSVQFANRAFLDWSGRSNAEAIGASILSMIGAVDNDAERTRIRQVIEQKQNEIIETPFLHKDGRRLLTSVTVSVFEADQATYPCLCFVDISGRDRGEPGAITKVEARLSESDARLRALAQASSEVVYRMSPDWGTMRELTGGGFLADTTGPSRGWLVDYIPDDEQPRVLAAIDHAISHRETFELEHPVRRADGTIGWTLSRAVPILDADGRITEWLGTASDVTDRRLAEERIRASEARLRHFGEASSDILWIRNAHTMAWEYLTPAYEAIFGIALDEALSGNNYRDWLELVFPDDRVRATQSLRRVRQGEHVTFEYRVRNQKSGKIHWLRNNDFPMFDCEGNVEFIGGIAEDITEARRSRELIEHSEERLRTATEVARLGLWDWDIKTGAIVWSDEHFRMEGYNVGEIIPSYQGWADRIHPDDRPGAEAALQKALQSRREFDHEFRSLHPDGSVHWLHGRGSFSYDQQGEPVRMVGAMLETTSWRQMEERQRVLVAELQHRTRNLIAVVRSIAGETLGTSRSLEHFKAAFNERLASLSRVQGLLSRSESEPITIGALVDLELRALGNPSGERVSISGPPVSLRRSSVQTIALALHELATNARKYGALSTTGGALSICWSLRQERDGGWLDFEWREEGINGPSRPPNGDPGGGYGRRLIEQSLQYTLSAKVDFELGATRLRCSIQLPLERK